MSASVEPEFDDFLHTYEYFRVAQCMVPGVSLPILVGVAQM